MATEGNEPIRANAEGGLVLVSGPGVVLSLTPMAAVELAQSLWTAAGFATFQSLGQSGPR